MIALVQAAVRSATNCLLEAALHSTRIIPGGALRRSLKTNSIRYVIVPKGIPYVFLDEYSLKIIIHSADNYHLPPVSRHM